MARPKLRDAEKKSKNVTVRFRACELEELIAQADVCGLSISELVRRRSLHRRVVAATDLKMLSELRRIGGLIKLLFTETNGRYGYKTGPLLDELHAAAIRLGRGGERE